MGRQENRLIAKDLKRGIGITKSTFNDDCRLLKNKIVSKDNIVKCNFLYDEVLYNLSPLFCIVKAIKDAKNDTSYLDTLLLNDYKNGVKNDNDDIVNICKIIDMLNFDLTNYKSDTSTKTDAFLYNSILSSYRFYNDLDESVLDFFKDFGVCFDYIHRDIVGYFLLLDSCYNSEVEHYKDVVLDDILNEYIALCGFIKAFNVSGLKKADSIKEFMMFTQICLGYLIEINSEGGVKYDLKDKLSSISDKYLNWLNYFAITEKTNMSEEVMLSFCDYVGKNKLYIKSIARSITAGVIKGALELKEKHKNEIRCLKGDYTKEINNLEKLNKTVNKDLSSITKKYNKLEKYLEKVKKVDREKEYKDKIAELELKNKQLESKLEGSNLRINTLNQKIIDLKEELDNVNKNEIVVDNGNVLNDSVLENEIDLSDMVSKLSNLNILLVGGTDNTYKKLNTYLPNLRYVAVEDGANFDVPLNTDYIVLCTKIMGHSHARRAEVFENTVKGIIKVNKTNHIEVMKEIYNTIVC